MTIISLKKQFMQFFNADILQKTAKRTGFIQRNRSVLPEQLVPSLVSALSKGNCHAIADLHRQFNGMCLTEKDNVAYKPFHNQLRKEAFPHFMQQLVQLAIAQFARQQCAQLPKKLSCFDDILLQDGSSFHVHKALADVYPSRFKRNPAAIECHMTMSLRTFNPTAMTITADTASERAYLPKPFRIKNKLLLADAGYPDFEFFKDVEQHNGFYIVRGAKSLNPTIVEARSGKVRTLPKLAVNETQRHNAPHPLTNSSLMISTFLPIDLQLSIRKSSTDSPFNPAVPISLMKTIDASIKFCNPFKSSPNLASMRLGTLTGGGGTW
jgi:hypothetical protein